MAAARARERALAGYRKEQEDEEEDDDDSTYLSDETSPMVDGKSIEICVLSLRVLLAAEDGNRVTHPKLLVLPSEFVLAAFERCVVLSAYCAQRQLHLLHHVLGFPSRYLGGLTDQ